MRHYAPVPAIRPGDFVVRVLGGDGNIQLLEGNKCEPEAYVELEGLQKYSQARDFCTACYESPFVDYNGNDLGTSYGEVSTPLECQQRCQKITGCQFFTYQDPGAGCFLKFSSSGRRVLSSDGNSFAISGPQFCPSCVTTTTTVTVTTTVTTTTTVTATTTTTTLTNTTTTTATTTTNTTTTTVTTTTKTTTTFTTTTTTATTTTATTVTITTTTTQTVVTPAPPTPRPRPTPPPPPFCPAGGRSCTDDSTCTCEDASHLLYQGRGKQSGNICYYCNTPPTTSTTVTSSTVTTTTTYTNVSDSGDVGDDAFGPDIGTTTNAPTTVAMATTTTTATNASGVAAAINPDVVAAQISPDQGFVVWVLVGGGALLLCVIIIVLSCRKKNPMEKPQRHTVLFNRQKIFAAASVLGMGLLPGLYIVLSLGSYVFAILEALLINSYETKAWFAAYLVVLGLEYYLVLFPALCYGFHSMDWTDMKALWKGGVLDKITLVLLPLTTVISVFAAGCEIAWRCARIATAKCLPESSSRMASAASYILAAPLAVVFAPFTVIFAWLLPMLWAAAVAFYLYILSPAFYYKLETLFIWSLEGQAAAFRADTVWRQQDSRRVEKVKTLFNPGDDDSKAGQDGMTASSVSFLVTFTLLVDVIVAGFVAIALDIIHTEAGGGWTSGGDKKGDEIYTYVSFAWTCLVFVYNMYLVVKMVRETGSLFKPSFFVKSDDTAGSALISPAFEVRQEPTHFYPLHQTQTSGALATAPNDDDGGTAPSTGYFAMLGSMKQDRPIRKSIPRRMPMVDVDGWTVDDVGTKVQVDGFSSEATLAFVGWDGQKQEMKCGIKFDDAVGDHGGIINMEHYFDCEPKHGILIKPSSVSY